MEIIDNWDEQARLFACSKRRTDAYLDIERVSRDVARIVLELCRNHCRTAFTTRSTQQAVIYCASTDRYSNSLDAAQKAALGSLRRSLKLRGLRLRAEYVTDDGPPRMVLTVSNPDCERLLRERFGHYFQTNIQLDYDDPDHFQAFNCIDGNAKYADVADLEHFATVLTVAWKPVISGDILDKHNDEDWR